MDKPQSSPYPNPIVVILSDSDSDHAEPQRAAKRQKMSPGAGDHAYAIPSDVHFSNSPQIKIGGRTRKPDPNLAHIEILPPKKPSALHTNAGQTTNSPSQAVPLAAPSSSAAAAPGLPPPVPASVTEPPSTAPPAKKVVIKMKRSGNTTLPSVAPKTHVFTTARARPSAVHATQPRHVPLPSVGISTPTSTPLPTPGLNTQTQSSPFDSPGIPKRPRGRPRKDGLNNRASRPDPVTLRSFSRDLNGRLYGRWEEDGGDSLFGMGVLFPTNYKPEVENRGQSWVCPVNGCLVTKVRLQALGNHFIQQHGDCMLYDLQDGHFQILGFHSGKDQPLVVCRTKAEFSAWEDAVAGPCAISVAAVKHPTPQRVLAPAAESPGIQATSKQSLMPQTAPRTSGSARVLTPSQTLLKIKLDEALGPEADDKGHELSKRTSSTLPKASTASPNPESTLTPPHLELEQISMPQIQPPPSTTPHLQNMDHLPMEEWELAPGHLLSKNPSKTEDGDPAPPESIAFSKPYLNANHSVRVGPEATFRVDTIKSGSVLRWTPKSDMLRIVSVAAGQIKVRIDGEDEFNLGAHGMFRLRGDKGCVLRNMLYGDAMLHVCEFLE